MANDLSTRRFGQALADVWIAFRRLEDQGELTSHERDVLAHVPDHDGVNLRDLAAHLAIGTSTASVLMKQFEQRGFVTRRRDPRDERRLALTLTPAGRDALDRASDLDRVRLDTALRTLGQAKARQLVLGLEELAAIGSSDRPRDGSTEPHRRPLVRR